VRDQQFTGVDSPRLAVVDEAGVPVDHLGGVTGGLLNFLLLVVLALLAALLYGTLLASLLLLIVGRVFRVHIL